MIAKSLLPLRMYGLPARRAIFGTLGLVVVGAAAVHGQDVIIEGEETITGVQNYLNTNVRVGWGSSATLNIQPGAEVLLETTTPGGIYQLSIGRSTIADPPGGDASTGTVNMYGGSLSFSAVEPRMAYMMIGGGTSDSTGTFNQYGGAVNLGQPLVLGFDHGTGIYNLSGGTLSATPVEGQTTRHIYIGYNQYTGDAPTTTQGILNVSGTGVFNMDPGSYMYVGAGNISNEDNAVYGGTGRIVQDGADSEVNFSGAGVFFGWGGGTSQTPIDGYGEYNLKAGTLNVLSGALVFGQTAGNTGVYLQEGGTLNSAVSISVGPSGTGAFTVSGGEAIFTAGALNIGANGTATVSGDGVLEVRGTNGITGSGEFILDGGTVRVGNADLTTSVAPTLSGTSTSTINTNGRNATLSGAIAGSQARLVKTGEGALNLTSDSESTVGQLLVNEGLTNVTSEMTVTGAAFSATTPNSGPAHRNAVIVQGTGTLALGAGADLKVINNDNNTTFLRVGYADGQSGVMTIGNGANLQVGQTSRYANFHIGETPGTTGAVIQNGGTVTTKGSFNVGVDGGTGTFTLNGGLFVLDHDENPANQTSLATIGLNLSGPGSPASTGAIFINGGTFNVTRHAFGGTIGSVSLILGNRSPFTGEGNGTLTQGGGVLRVENGAGLYLSSVGNGTYNLNAGGVLEIGANSLQANYNNGGGTYAFNLGGGTIRVIQNDLTTAVNMNLVDGTADGGVASVVDADGYNATFSGAINGAQGGLVKVGSGTMIFTGSASRTIGYWNTDEGTTVQSNGTTTTAEFVVGSNYGVKNGVFVLNGGDIYVTGTTQATGTNSSMRVGDFGGTGQFIQNGGSVTVGGPSQGAALNIGNQGGHGTYTLNSGTVTLDGGLNVLGRSTSTNPISSGTLNINGGLFEIKAGSSLINGNNISDALNKGTGTINQTNGVMRVSGGTLYVAGFGNGTYNLNGGALEVGGSNLIARYNNTTSNYAFNLGGGTVRVINSNLNASLDINLKDGTAHGSTGSKIDTNNLNATFTGNINGAQGGLIKVGSGTVTFGGNVTRTIGYWNTDEGVTVHSAGDTTTTEFVVGSNFNAKNGTFILEGGSIVLSGSTPASSSSASLRVGDFGGTGEFIQNGGSITAGGTPGQEAAINIGNQGGNGTFTLNSGTVTLAGGNSVLGRSTGSNAGSTGVLNIYGGLFDITVGSALINGNNISNASNLGTGTINQTNGVMRVSGGTLYVAGFGNGTYNLNGGTLEVGGAGLDARYNNDSSVSTFNFGGGALRVIGSDLLTDVRPKLVASSTSTIDTNGLNARFTEGIEGSGALRKIGVGSVEFAGPSTVGSLLLEGGQTTFEGTVTAQGSVILSGGAALVLENASNSAWGSVTVGSGSELAGSISSNGETRIASGGLHSLGRRSVSAAGSYVLEEGASLRLELAADLTGVRLGYLSGLTLATDSTLYLFSDLSYQPEVGTTFDLLASVGGLNIGAVNLVGEGGLSGYTFELSETGVLSVVAVPEPGVLSLLVLGAVAAGWMARRRMARA